AIRNPDFLRKNINKSWDEFTKAAEKADYSKVAAKVFGDTVSKSTGFALDGAFSKLMPKLDGGSRQPSMQLQSAIAGADFVSYKTSLENGLDTEIGLVTKQLTTWKANLNGSYNFGGDILRE